MAEPSVLVVIGARAGSKGLKGKNVRLLKGKPLIAYTIEQALRWGKAKHVVVSTESEEIAEIAKHFGAEVPFMRPAELATDWASKGPVIRHALVSCEEIFQETYDIVLDLDVTAPVRTLKDLDECLKLFLESRPKTLFSVVKAHKNPYFNMVEEKGNGNIEVCKSADPPPYRRQDAPVVYVMNASIYLYDRNYVLSCEDPSPFSDQTKIYVMDDVSGIDIDRGIDFKFIEFLVEEGIVQL